ncbi:MAG: hypothetical protein WBI01_00505 [Syntrophomonadaceae bacterium]
MKFKEADFYYGAVLSLLFNNGIDPALVESSNSRQIYDFTTDNVDFRLFFASTFSLFLQTPSAAATQGNLRVIFH